MKLGSRDQMLERREDPGKKTDEKEAAIDARLRKTTTITVGTHPICVRSMMLGTIPGVPVAKCYILRVTTEIGADRPGTRLVPGAGSDGADESDGAGSSWRRGKYR
jgi:hypothetical protein